MLFDLGNILKGYPTWDVNINTIYNKHKIGFVLLVIPSITCRTFEANHWTVKNLHSHRWLMGVRHRFKMPPAGAPFKVIDWMQVRLDYPHQPRLSDARSSFAVKPSSFNRVNRISMRSMEISENCRSPGWHCEKGLCCRYDLYFGLTHR